MKDHPTWAEFPDSADTFNAVRFASIATIEVEPFDHADRGPLIRVVGASGRSYEFFFCTIHGFNDALSRLEPQLTALGFWKTPMIDPKAWINPRQVESVRWNRKGQATYCEPKLSITVRFVDKGVPDFEIVDDNFETFKTRAEYFKFLIEQEPAVVIRD